MSVSIQPYKGARDFYPEDKQLQNWLFAKWRHACELFGYEEYDAPILEDTSLFLIKGSQEIVNEQTYTFTDRGGRSITVRTEMTPSVSRMVAAKRQELSYPLRWYSIPELWRYERPQRGRSRQFWQLNADIFGVDNLSAELEAISLADYIMQSFKANRSTYQIKINNRKLVDYVLRTYIGMDEVEADTVRRLIDKMHKIDRANFVAMLESSINPTLRQSGAADRLLSVLECKSIADLPPELHGQQSVADTAKLIKQLSDNGVSNVVFDITLMRGFDYYTDMVFEIFDTDPENNRSMFGGGRYDGLVGQFGVEPVPTVGFAMGDVTLTNFLQAHKLMPKLPTTTELYIVPIDVSLNELSPLLNELRSEGLKVAVDISGRKIDKQIKTAEKKRINNVLFVGSDELEKGIYKLKDLTSGEESELSSARLISKIKDIRS